MNGSGYGGSSPSDESILKICMTVCIPSSILTLAMGRVSKMEVEKWGGVWISVDTFMQGLGCPYTLYLLAQSSHIEDLLSATLGISCMVNDNKEVTLS